MRDDKATGPAAKEWISTQRDQETGIETVRAHFTGHAWPHSYLVQLRLKIARRLLSGGWSPADAAAEVGFADQSHLGRWFRRAYRVTPAAYRSACTNVPDPR